MYSASGSMFTCLYAMPNSKYQLYGIRWKNKTFPLYIRFDVFALISQWVSLAYSTGWICYYQWQDVLSSHPYGYVCKVTAAVKQTALTYPALCEQLCDGLLKAGEISRQNEVLGHGAGWEVKVTGLKIVICLQTHKGGKIIFFVLIIYILKTDEINLKGYSICFKFTWQESVQ